MDADTYFAEVCTKKASCFSGLGLFAAFRPPPSPLPSPRHTLRRQYSARSLSTLPGGGERGLHPASSSHAWLGWGCFGSSCSCADCNALRSGLRFQLGTGAILCQLAAKIDECNAKWNAEHPNDPPALVGTDPHYNPDAKPCSCEARFLGGFNPKTPRERHFPHSLQTTRCMLICSFASLHNPTLTLQIQWSLRSLRPINRKTV